MHVTNSPFRSRRGLVAAMAVGVISALLTGCGSQTASTPAIEAEPGCSADIPKISESTDFTPPEARRGFEHDELPATAVDPELLQTPFAKSVAGVPAGAMIHENGVLIVMYTDLPVEKATTENVVSAGGAVLSARPSDGGDVVRDMTEVIGDRATPVDVGPYKAVLTWADPDETGLRPHHVIWINKDTSYELVLDRSAEESVGAARSMVCG